MLAWIGENWGNVVVIGILCAVIFLIVRSRVRAKRQGRLGCGCGCTECAMRDRCHPQK